MTTPILDPAQWLARLFRPEPAFPAQLQEMATHVAALQQNYFRQITALWPAPPTYPAAGGRTQDTGARKIPGHRSGPGPLCEGEGAVSFINIPKEKRHG